MKAEFNSFFIDIKNFFIDLYNNIHEFLNKYLDDTTLGILGIILVAGLLLFIFRRISEHN